MLASKLPVIWYHRRNNSMVIRRTELYLFKVELYVLQRGKTKRGKRSVGSWREAVKHGLYGENFRRPFPFPPPFPWHLRPRNGRRPMSFSPPRLKRLTVKLIESFKVIGIDNGEVNKSHHHPASSPTPPLKGGVFGRRAKGGGGWGVGGRERSRKSRKEPRERETTRGGTNVLCHIPPPPPYHHRYCIFRGNGEGVRLGPL